MFNEIEATVFLILGHFPEAVTGVTSGFRQSSIACPCASCFSPRKKPVIICSSQDYIFLLTMVLLKSRFMDKMLYTSFKEDAVYSHPKVLSWFPPTDITVPTLKKKGKRGRLFDAQEEILRSREKVDVLKVFC